MIKKYKNKSLYILITLFLFCFNILPNNTAFAATTTDEKNIDLVILFNDNAVDKNVENTITSSGGKIVKEFPDLGGIEVKCPFDLVPAIKSKDGVQSLAPNHVIKLSNEKTEGFTKSSDDSNSTSDDLYQNYQWDIKRVTNDGKSFNLESGNHNVVVGIIDSGVDTTHPDLVDNFLGGKNLVSADFEDDLSETGDPDDITDRFGHGTNVTGLILIQELNIT
jgi:subtilisin family serine protease